MMYEHRVQGSWFDLKRSEWPFDHLIDYPLGAIVGVATLGRVFGPGEQLSEDEARFYVGNDLLGGGTWGLRFDDAQFFNAPIAAKGALGFWTLPPELEAAVRAQMGAEK